MTYPENVTECLPLEDVEKAELERGDEFGKTGTAYALEQATRPSTIGFVLSSSPLALLAWYAQKSICFETYVANCVQDRREILRLVRHDTISRPYPRGRHPLLADEHLPASYLSLSGGKCI